MKTKILTLLFAWVGLGLHAQIVSGTLLVQGSNRNYDIYLPSGWQPGMRLPLVIDFHYLGADGRDQDTLSQFNPIADAEHFIVCHPFGTGTNWDVGQNSPYVVGSGDVLFINTLIDTLNLRYGLEMSQIYAVGMGQGGFMVHRLACDLSDRIAAVAVVGGSIADSTAYFCSSNRPIPMMIVHGTADSVVPYYTGLAGYWSDIPHLLDFWRQRNGCTGSPVVTNLPDLVNEGSSITTQSWPCDQGTEMLHYQVVNGGFAWPGSSRDLGSGGNRNMDINASAHIWDFFKRFDLDGPVSTDNQNVILTKYIQAYPQPCKDILHVKGFNTSVKDLKIRDLSGKVMEVDILEKSDGEIEIRVEKICGGVYELGNKAVNLRIIVVK